MEKILNRFNVVFLFLVVFLCCAINFITSTYGKVDIVQLVYFIQIGNVDGLGTSFCFKMILWCVLVPVVITFLVFLLFNFLKRDRECFVEPAVFVIFAVGLVVFCSKYFDYELVSYISWVLLFIFVLLLNFNYKPSNILFLIVFFVFVMWGVYAKQYGNMFDIREYGETNFYKENYKEVVGENINKRNVIVVFLESFNEEYSRKPEVKVNDDDAVKFDNFIEGYVQRWTQGALFSAFTGVHIHYLSDFFRYKAGFKIKKFESLYNVKYSENSNDLGEIYNFYTPKIDSLGKIAKEHNYQNLFIQGTSVDFSGTRDFLLNNGFDKDNIYGYDELINKVNIKNVSGTMLYGIDDEKVYSIFKDKISKLDETKPFLAVMFTVDLHITGDDDIENNIGKIVKQSIYNLNDFIEWFKKQDFYENTTLVVIGDHNRMGRGIETGGKIYNAFFNLPDRLKENINEKRTFNQIDVFPTILEIMGFDLEHKQAGVGVSLFSDKKTIAERYSYDEQKNIFSKYDDFYYDLWQNDKGIDNKKEDTYKIYDKFIAHAGGGINGDIYTNSLEAVELSKERGYRFIELDLFATNDEQKRIVAYHNCEDLNRYSSKNIDCSSMKFDDFINLDSKYTLLYDEKILEYFERYKHLWLVTDKIDDFDLLSEKFKLIKDRMIVEVFSYSKYIEASIKGFQNLAYNIGNKKDFELVEDKNIKQVTISIDFARKQIGEIKKLKDKGVKILGFTAKKTDEIAEIREYIDMFYYDGEENLDELNLNVD